MKVNTYSQTSFKKTSEYNKNTSVLSAKSFDETDSRIDFMVIGTVSEIQFDQLRSTLEKTRVLNYFKLNLDPFCIDTFCKILNLLPTISNLKTLDLSDNLINDNHLKIITESIRIPLPHIEKLYLDKNQFGEDNFQSALIFVKKFPRLKELSVTENNIRSINNEFISYIKQSCINQIQINYGNSINDSTYKEISNAIKAPKPKRTLHILDLGSVSLESNE